MDEMELTQFLAGISNEPHDAMQSQEYRSNPDPLDVTGQHTLSKQDIHFAKNASSRSKSNCAGSSQFH
jgi:hypothetical protein